MQKQNKVCVKAYRQKMHAMCDKKILQNCFDKPNEACYNGVGLNLFLLSVPDFWCKIEPCW